MNRRGGANPFVMLGVGSLLVAAAATLAWTTVWNEDSHSNATPSTSSELTVEYVIDGETLAVVDAAGLRERVRIIGVDTPEIGRDGNPDECYAQAARAFLEHLVDDGHATFYADESQGDRDQYERLLRHVDVDGESVAVQLIEFGAGHEYTFDTPYTGQGEHRAAQQRAIAAQAGLWGSCPTH